MPVNTDLLNSIISGLNSLPKKSEIDTADNDIDLLATETTHGLMSYEDKSKLNKIDEGANNYTLPIASYDVLGGIKSGNQEIDSTGLEPIPIIDGIPYYKPYELPIASSSTLGGIKAGDGVDISSEGILTIKSVNFDNFEGVLAVEKGGTGAENKVDARKKLNTIPYVICGNITSTDETNSGYYHIFSLNQYSNNTICLKILISSKISEPTMFDLILISDDSTKSKPVVKLYEATRSNVSNLLSMLYVVQTDTESSGEIQLWYKNVSANTPIKVTIIQVSSLYSNDEHDIVSLSSIPNTAVDVMSTTLNNVYSLKNCISSSEATVDEPGFMSSSDKIKLDAFEITTTGGKLHDKEIATIDDIPTSLPANGGDADTIDGLHAADFANAYNDYLGTYLAGKSGDIRELAYLLPTGGLIANTSYSEFENITFPIYGNIVITWDKSKFSQNGHIYGVLTIRPMISTGDTYICSVYNTLAYTDWQKISDGGNADTANKLTTARTISLTGNVTGSGSFDGSTNLSIATTCSNASNADTVGGISNGYYLGTLDIRGGTHGAAYRLQCQYSLFGDDRFGLKIESGHQVRCDYATTANAVNNLRDGTRYTDAFSTTLTISHGCWNKWCVVTGNGTDSSAADYVPNSPYKNSALWFEVLTLGILNRAFQLAIGCYNHQRHMFIRYMHDSIWSGWYNINTTAI